MPIPAWTAAAFETELEPLATTQAGAPVWTVRDAVTTATISDQFRAEAGDYHARYAASDHFEGLFRQALAATGVEVAPAPLVLDLGSGSGANSVAPCLRLFPGARIVATDLSAELLAILADDLPRLDAADRVACVAMDAMSAHPAAGAFDLVTGAAILHHLDHPGLGLRAASRALKPGGTAVFFEPFDGYGVLRLAYQWILAEDGLRGGALGPEIRAGLGALATDIAARTMPDRDAPGFALMDDKWLFSPENIVVGARKNGFTRVEFVPHNDHAGLYRDAAQVQLRLMTGQADLTLPDWALGVLDEFDAAIPLLAKRRMMLEATIVLTKGAAP